MARDRRAHQLGKRKSSGTGVRVGGRRTGGGLQDEDLRGAPTRSRGALARTTGQRSPFKFW
eukprot:10929428-Alexandrium_andersonii.AAC.1